MKVLRVNELDTKRTIVLNVDHIESYSPVWNGTTASTRATMVTLASGATLLIDQGFEDFDTWLSRFRTT